MSNRSRSGWLLPPLLVLTALVVYPLILVATESFTGGLTTWREVVGSTEFRDALLRTIQIATCSTIGCLIVGTFLAVVITFVPFPGARVIAGLVDAMLALPSFLVALSFTFIYGTTGVLGSLVGAGTFLTTPWACPSHCAPRSPGKEAAVLLWTKPGKLITWIAFALVFGLLVLAPFIVVAAAAFAGSWNGVLPSDPTASHLTEALSGDELASLTVSLQTAFLGGLLAVVLGTWAALAAQAAPRALARFADALHHLPIAVPSVVVGLSLLVAFSRQPLLLNGTKWIVVIAHLVLMVAFSYGTVAAALQRTDSSYSEVAASLGASPARVLWRIRLPMLRPAIVSAASLSIALSMGEVGATIMVYPASWRTLPVSVFALTDRGQTFTAAAESLVLLAVTVALVVTLDRLHGRSLER